MNCGSVLDESFWRMFARCYWERRPAVFQDVAGAPLLDADELFGAIQAASNAWRAGAEPVFGLWVDGQVPRPPHERFLAAPIDRSLTDYVQRVVDEDVELCLAQFDLQYWWPPAMDRVHAFLGGLIEQIGLPVRDVDVDTFVGRYRETPRGIHRDPAGTFMFVVQGVKRITVWPPETFRPETYHLVGAGGKQVVHGLDRADAPDGLDLVGKPGDILYWPSSYWHVGTAVDPGAVTAAVNVGLFLEPGGASIAAEVVDAVLRDAGLRTGHRGLYDTVRSETSVPLPAREKDLLDVLATLVATGSLERLVHAQWMHRVSASGVTATPPLRTVQTELPTRVVRGGQGTVLWYVDGEHAFVSAGGHGERFRGTDGVLLLLDVVATMQVGDEVDLLNLVAGDPSAEAAARWLLSTRVLAEPDGWSPFRALP